MERMPCHTTALDRIDNHRYMSAPEEDQRREQIVERINEKVEALRVTNEQDLDELIDMVLDDPAARLQLGELVRDLALGPGHGVQQRIDNHLASLHLLLRQNARARFGKDAAAEVDRDHDLSMIDRMAIVKECADEIEADH